VSQTDTSFNTGKSTRNTLHKTSPSLIVIYGSTVLSIILYVLVGALGAYAIPQVNPNVLEPMVSGAFGEDMRLGASIFAFFIIGLDIPLFSVLTRYNLVNSGLVSKSNANLLVIYIPWGLSWLFYQGNDIADLLSWGGVLFTSFVAFILPLALALYTLSRCEYPGSIKVGFSEALWVRKGSLIVLLVAASLSVAVAIGGLAKPPRPIQYTDSLTGKPTLIPPPDLKQHHL
jgi:hypothetical protein